MNILLKLKKNFFFPQSSTIDLISSCRFVIFSETTLINQIIFRKKNYIIRLKFLGNYYSSKVNSIKNEIDLFGLSLENLDLITKDKLEYQMKKK